MPDHRDNEHPHNHLLQGRMPIVFIVAWILDSFLLNISTPLSDNISIAVRLAIGIPFPLLAFYLMKRSHRMIFEENEMQGLIDTGVYDSVRPPMYLGSMMIYVFFILITLSILAFVTWIAIFTIYDRLAAYEERILLEQLGEDYADYMKRVHRWLPI